MKITELKQSITIKEVADHFGIKTNRHGKACCPFHDDKTPSLQISEEKQIATCFSSKCGAGTMDIISFTEKKIGGNTKAAIAYLASAFPSRMGSYLGNPREEKEKPSTSKETTSALLQKVFALHRKGIATSAGAKYLTSRGLNHKAIEVGYDNSRSHTYLKEHIEELKTVGLVRDYNGNNQSFFRYCITFPLKNKKDEIVSFYGRNINDYGEKHFYLKKRRGLYPCYPKQETKRLILTESIIDAATLLEYKEAEILALYGVNGLTEEHKEAIKSLKNLEEVILFFDGDEAGRTAAEKYGKELQELKLKIKVVDTPEGEDINSLALGHEQEIFTHLIENARKYEVEKTETTANSGLLTSDSKETPDSSLNKLNTEHPYNFKYLTEVANYYIKGGIDKNGYDTLKVTIHIEHKYTKKKSRTRIDLYEDKNMEKFSREASEKLGLRQDLIEIDLNKLTDQLEEYRDNQTPKTEEVETTQVIIPKKDKDNCLAFLKKPNLIENLNKLIGKAGVVGEEENRLFLFSLASSYKMPDTLHALVQGSSGSGKTHLIVKIAELMPPEDVNFVTRVTESSFYNFGEYELCNTLFCMEDLDGLKEEAFLAFRELMSRGQLSTSTSVKDEHGNISAKIKTVKGPIATLSATTKGEIYEDNMSRSFLISVDESAGQTERIIQYQNKRASGSINKEEERKVRDFIRNCMRLLQPLEVVNPYASQIALPKEAHKIRRLNDLYHSFVKQITLLNQYQRKRDRQGRLITEKEDLETANQIMFESIVLKVDELDGSLRQFYEDLKAYIKTKGEEYQNYAFGRKEIRDVLRVSKPQQHRYFTSLVSMEYLCYVGGSSHGGYKYRILVWDDMQALRSRLRNYLKGQIDQLSLFEK